MSLGNRIKTIRKSKKMTQKDLAQKIGKSYSVVQKYELDITQPPLDVLKTIATALEVNYTQLIYEPLQIITEEEANEREKIRNDDILSVVSQELEKGSKINWLIKDYVKLNSKGKFEANKRVGELSQIKEYTTPDEE